MSGLRFLLVASTLLIAAFVGANLILQSSAAKARLDLTENRIFTLSEGTRSTLQELSDPIDLTFVYTQATGQDYPAVQAHAVRVRELLRTYEIIAGGKLRVQEIDPTPFSEAEDEALQAGLVAVATDGSDPLYMGLIARNSVDDERILAFLAPEQEASFEYNLTRMIARLNQAEPPRVGLLSTLPGMIALSDDAGYAIRQDIAKSYALQQIAEDFESLPPELDVLFLAHPPALTDQQYREIDQFILRKGRALILIDPAAKSAFSTNPFDLADTQTRSDLGALGRAWGIDLTRDALADTQTALAIEVDDGMGRTNVQNHPLFLSVPPGLMSADSPITATLTQTVNLGAPGGLRLTPPESLTIRPLMETGPAPSTIPADSAAAQMTAAETLDLYRAGQGPELLAARLSGPLSSAYDGPAPGAEPASEDAPQFIESSLEPVEIIIVADADFLDDGLHTSAVSGTRFADNSAFILNALDSLTGASTLMDLRARSDPPRKMTRVETLRRDAQERLFERQSRLQARLAETEAELANLQSIGASDAFYEGDAFAELSDSEQARLTELRRDIVDIRTDLRSIERDFRRNIDALEMRLRAFTLLTGPLLLAGLAAFVWWRRRQGGGA